MHNRFGLMSVKQHLQWKLPSVLRALSTLPSPADPQKMVPAEDLVNPGKLGVGCPMQQASFCLPWSSCAWLAFACE